MSASPSSSRCFLVVAQLRQLAVDRDHLPAFRSTLVDLSDWPNGEVRGLLEQLAEIDSTEGSASLGLEAVAQSLASRWSTGRSDARAADETDATLDAWRRLYAALPQSSAVRNYLLGALAAGGTAQALQEFADVCCDDPPLHTSSLGVAMAPLINLPQPHCGDLFPRLLDGVQHRHLAAAIFDVSNHAYASGKLSVHPAHRRVAALHRLLGELVDKLGAVESTTPSADEFPRRSEQVGESVALLVSLSRALGLIGATEALPNLQRTLRLKHRRVRAEAAAALAQLGDSQGVDALVELAQWPVSRLRALAYADEFGEMERIDPKFRTDVARAEGQLAAWLAEPAQFGVAPTGLELVDQRELFWPGYDEPHACFLFRFVYGTPPGSWSNIGIAGPATLASSASLEHLAIEQIYALFAGWQTAHDEIYEFDLESLSPERRASIRRQANELPQRGYQFVEPVFVGKFFGDEFLVATAQRDNQPGHLIGNEGDWFWLQDEAKGLSSEQAYSLFKGQKLLASFNPDFARETIIDPP